MSVTRLTLRAWRGDLFRSLARCAIRRPRHALLIAALAVLCVAPGIGRLQVRTDGHALVPQNAPEVLYDEGLRTEFGIKDTIVVLIRSSHPDGIFNPATLQLVRDLSAEFQKIPGLAPADVMSLATEKGLRVGAGMHTFQTLLEPAPTSKAELDQLREDLRRIELYTGTLVSSDGKSTVILVGMPDGAARPRLHAQILGIIAAQGGTDDQIGVTGAPVAESLLGAHILRDLGLPRAFLGVGAQGIRDETPREMPASLRQLRLFVSQRVGLVPVAVLVMMAIFLLCFRNVLAALLPLPGVVATILFVLGLMGWLGVPVYLTTAVMPLILTVISVTNDIYLCSRYFSLLREKPGLTHVELVEEALESLTGPVTCTSLTAVIGFLSFGLSPLGPVRAFGIFTGVGAFFGLLFSLTAVPALLVIINPAWLISRRRREAKSAPFPGATAFARLGQVIVRRRWWVAGVALVAMGLTPLGLRRLVVQDSWINGFDPESEFRRVTRLVNDNFFGIHQLVVSFDAPRMITGVVANSNASPDLIVLSGDLVGDPVLITGGSITLSVPEESPTGSRNDRPHAVWRSHIEAAARNGDRVFARLARADPSGRFWDEFRKTGQARFEIVVRTHTSPDVIREIADLAAFIRKERQCGVGGVLSPADYLSTARFMVRSGDPNARQLSDNAAELKLLWDYCGVALGPQRLRRIVDTNYWQSLTTVFLKDANFVDTAKLMSDIRDYEREHLAPKGIKIGFAGDVAVSQSLIRGIVNTQLQSLIWSLLGIFLVTAFFGGSWRWGFYCLLPSLLAVVIKFAVMGFAGIPLGVATSMFAAMTLGIGVNCAIHLLEGCRQARAAGASPTEALNSSLGLTGPPALINTLAMSFGFGVLVLSQVPANARLGILLVLGLVNCFVASLLLLPALLHWLPLKNLDGTRLPNCHKLQE